MKGQRDEKLKRWRDEEIKKGRGEYKKIWRFGEIKRWCDEERKRSILMLRGLTLSMMFDYEENWQVIDDDFGVSHGFCFDTQATLLILHESTP